MAVPRHTPVTAIAIAGMFLVGVFVLDLFTPLGIPVWLLYGVPFLFLQAYRPRYHVHGLAIVCTFLIWIGYFLSPQGHPQLTNERFGATIIVWCIVLLFARRKPSLQERS
jgi:hypothetical protein